MVGFPKSSIIKVIDKLESALVKYHFLDSDLTFNISDKANQYNSYLSIINKTELVKNNLDVLNKKVKELVLNDFDNYNKILGLLDTIK